MEVPSSSSLRVRGRQVRADEVALVSVPEHVMTMATAFDQTIEDVEHAEQVQRWAMLIQLLAEW